MPKIAAFILSGMAYIYCAGHEALASEAITPLRTTMVFTIQSVKDKHIVPIRSPDGRTVYRLSVEPDFDADNNVMNLNLVLRRPSDTVDSPNRFDPTGRAHGYQKWIFGVSDFARGAQKSLYGERRTIILRKVGLEADIDVLKAVVIPDDNSMSGYYWKELDLGIYIHRLIH
jgi:hypothetical protein